jgi:hypothetical protein
MTTPLSDRDCLECTPEEMALAERLGLEGRERILSRMRLGTPSWSLSRPKRTTSRKPGHTMTIAPVG